MLLNPKILELTSYFIIRWKFLTTGTRMSEVSNTWVIDQSNVSVVGWCWPGHAYHCIQGGSGNAGRPSPPPPQWGGSSAIYKWARRLAAYTWTGEKFKIKFSEKYTYDYFVIFLTCKFFVLFLSCNLISQYWWFGSLSVVMLELSFLNLSWC